MRIAHRNFVLAGVWLGLLVLSWALQGPGSGQAQREIGRLFPDFQRADAARVVIERPARTDAPDARQTVELVRRDGGPADALWVLPEHFDHPAGSVSLEQLFDALTSLTNLDLLAESAASHVDYGVDAAGLVLRVFDGSGDLLAGLVQGAQATPAAGSGLASYVRVLGSDEVFRAPRVGAIPTDPRRWLERRWLSFEPALVRAVRVTEDDVTETWSRTEMERWSRDGKAVSARIIRSLLDRLNACFLDDVLAAGPGERAAVQRITLVMLDDTEFEMNFAKADPEGSRAAWRGVTEPVVRFSASTCARLQKSLEALRAGR
ncbi:MAG: hypothetical protein ACI8QZ_001418 [Chlamydiales bacterium]|jgi:hypothetical protein